ncbi:MAG: hypothetical protein L0Y67_03045 [Gammaproteobacteria bacterium]|nr:hypothetical protein [Gammaproteobacteria bacterium]MCI0590571.1 hypothetical protein [Gammaproteobacteria bacterium]
MNENSAANVPEKCTCGAHQFLACRPFSKHPIEAYSYCQNKHRDVAILSFGGGCAGSTGGGVKIVRVLLLFKQELRELERLIDPNAIIPIKIGGRSLLEGIVDAAWGFSPPTCLPSPSCSFY